MRARGYAHGMRGDVNPVDNEAEMRNQVIFA